MMTENSLKSPSLVFFGNERLATGVTTDAPVLKALIAAGYHVESIIVNNEAARSRKQRRLEVAEVATDHNIPVLSEFSSELKSPLAVLVAYGRIVPQTVIDHFKLGIVNIHPSRLPHYRGSTPIESAILNDLETSAVSLMQLSAKMDAGSVYAQKEVPQIRNQSKQHLADEFGKRGAELLINKLPSIIDQSLKPQLQNEAQATYTQQITKTDGLIDWHKPAAQLEREIRAYAGWPGSSVEINNRPVTIIEAMVLKQNGPAGEAYVHNRQLAVYCGTGSLLIHMLKPAGKNIMSSQAYLAGNPLI